MPSISSDTDFGMIRNSFYWFEMNSDPKLSPGDNSKLAVNTAKTGGKCVVGKFVILPIRMDKR